MDFAENTLGFFLLLSGVSGREKQGRGERETVIPAMGGLAGGEGGVEERGEIGADL